jgi:hypothetical protein
MSSSANSPWRRIRAGIASHQHFIWPVVIVSALGIAQQFVPWYAVWLPFLAIAGFYIHRATKTPEVTQQEIQKKEFDSEQIAAELLAEEEAVRAASRDKQKREDDKRRAAVRASTPKSETQSHSKKSKSSLKDVDDGELHHLAAFARGSVKGVPTSESKSKPEEAKAPATPSVAPPSSGSKKRKNVTADGWEQR